MAVAMYRFFSRARTLGVVPERFDELLEVVRDQWVEVAAKRLRVSPQYFERESAVMLATKHHEDFQLLMEQIVTAKPRHWKKKRRTRVKHTLMALFYTVTFSAGIVMLIALLSAVAEHGLIPEELLRRLLVPNFSAMGGE